MKSGTCWSCHALGTKATREIPAALPRRCRTLDAWQRRLQSGQAGRQHDARHRPARQRSARWRCSRTGPTGSRRAKLPPAPPRPQGLERNVVITEWDWADPKAYLHDEVSTDRRNPTRNANGLIYGSLELSADYLPVLDPGRTTPISRVPLTVRDPATPPTSAGDDRSRRRTGAASRSGRARTTSTTRCSTSRAASGSRPPCARPPNPDFCKAGSDHPSAKLYPLNNAGRHLAMYDPKTKQITHISTCFSTHHLMFAEDANHTLWTSGGGAGRRLAEHEDVRGDARRGEVAGLDGARSSTRTATASATRTSSRTSRSIPRRTSGSAAAFYAVAPAPDGSVWGIGARYSRARSCGWCPGSNPPETALAEVYEPPFENPKATVQGFSPRGDGRRSQRRRLGGARQRPHRQLRSPQVQGAAERSDGDRPALPRGLDALRRAAAAAEGRDRSRQRRRELLHVGRSVRHARARREHADQHRQRRRRRCSR